MKSGEVVVVLSGSREAPLEVRTTADDNWLTAILLKVKTFHFIPTTAKLIWLN